VLAALVRVLAERPQLHRFVIGGHVYQRRQLQVAFAVKKRIADDAGVMALQRRLDAWNLLPAVLPR